MAGIHEGNISLATKIVSLFKAEDPHITQPPLYLHASSAISLTLEETSLRAHAVLHTLDLDHLAIY